MPATSIRNAWLVGLCGVFEAIYAALNLLMVNPDGSLEWRTYAPRITIALLGRFALAAGACAIAASVWKWESKRSSLLLLLHGLALSAYGLLSMFWSEGRHGILPVAVLFMVMALSAGVFALATAVPQRRWLLVIAGAGTLAFTPVFLAMGFGWLRLPPPVSYFVVISAYFGISAACMLLVGAGPANARRLAW